MNFNLWQTFSLKTSAHFILLSLKKADVFFCFSAKADRTLDFSRMYVGTISARWAGMTSGVRDWFTAARLKWEEPDGLICSLCYTRCHFILKSQPSVDLLLPYWTHTCYIHLPAYFTSKCSKSTPCCVFLVTHLFRSSFRPFCSLWLSLGLPVCLSAICSVWCECLALEGTVVSLCVRKLTAQITWHNET